jgi:methylphosphotriester-DNA--protein-cysteine methyltransferase
MVFSHSLLKNADVHSLIRKGAIRLGGNKKLRIYGKLDCVSGMKMQRKNRIFFSDSREAESLHFRPCAHCMRDQYQQWKNEICK